VVEECTEVLTLISLRALGFFLPSALTSVGIRGDDGGDKGTTWHH